MRVYLKINGKTHYLWRAVDQDGNVLDMRVAEPTQQTGSEEILSETAERTAIRATSDDYRQAGQLRRRQEGDHGKCGASTTQGIKQPSGTLASVDQATRADDAALQIP
jgi:transposase-like protein